MGLKVELHDFFYSWSFIMVLSVNHPACSRAEFRISYEGHHYFLEKFTIGISRNILEQFHFPFLK